MQGLQHCLYALFAQSLLGHSKPGERVRVVWWQSATCCQQFKLPKKTNISTYSCNNLRLPTALPEFWLILQLGALMA